MWTHRTFRTALCVLTCVVLALTSAVATAQEDATTTTLLDNNLDAYWGKKRQIKTIQKRLFLKETRWQFSLFGGVIPNDDFQIFFPVGGRAAYFFAEDMSAEISAAYALATETELRSFLLEELEQGGGTDADIFLTQFIDWYSHADFIWSPFHGKLGLFATKLFHFDFYTAVGAGVMGLVVDRPGAAAPESDLKVAGNVGVGTMMYVLDYMAVRLDYRHYFFEFAAGPGLSYPAELTLGVAFFTSAPD